MADLGPHASRIIYAMSFPFFCIQIHSHFMQPNFVFKNDTLLNWWKWINVSFPQHWYLIVLEYSILKHLSEENTIHSQLFHGLLRQLLHSGLYGKKLSILCVSWLSNPLVGQIGLSYISMGICIFEYVSLISIPHSSWHAQLHKCWSKLSKNNKNHGFFFCFSF